MGRSRCFFRLIYGGVISLGLSACSHVCSCRVKLLGEPKTKPCRAQLHMTTPDCALFRAVAVATVAVSVPFCSVAAHFGGFALGPALLQATTSALSAASRSQIYRVQHAQHGQDLRRTLFYSFKVFCNIYVYPLGFYWKTTRAKRASSHRNHPFTTHEWDFVLHSAGLGQQGYRGYPRLRVTCPRCPRSSVSIWSTVQNIVS